MRGAFCFPEALEESMSKYGREAREQLELSRVVDEISSTIREAIDSLLHDRIYAEIARVVNELLCIREEVTLFSREGTARQDGINEALRTEVRRLKRRVDELGSRSGSLHFPSCVGRERTGSGVEGLVKEVYEFMQQNEASKLFRECEARLERFEEQLRQCKYSSAHSASPSRSGSTRPASGRSPSTRPSPASSTTPSPRTSSPARSRRA